MTKELLIGAGIYLAVINIIAVIVTCADKKRAQKSGSSRVPEKTLFIISLLGGAPLMYITMKKIRHKTLHKRFMIGIPLIMVLHSILIASACYLVIVKKVI